MTTFPLEFPVLPRRRRRRDPVIRPTGLPYFITGPENQMAAFVATAPPDSLRIGNPMLWVGPAGSGKTSLAMHLAARLASSLVSASSESASAEEFPAGLHASTEDSESFEARPAEANFVKTEPAKTLYLPATDYAREYAEAVEVDDVAGLRQRLLDAGVLVIDDLHFLDGKTAATEELGRRIDQRVATQRPVILTCRRMPGEIKGLPAAFVSRIMPGLTVPLAYPRGDTRRELLQAYLFAKDLEVAPECVAALVDGMPDELAPPQIEAAVSTMDLHARMRGSAIDMEAVQAAMDQCDQRRELSFDKITKTVAAHYQMKVGELKSPSRQKSIVRARSLAMWIARRLTGKSTHRIGDYFGGRDHTTVMHAIRKISREVETDDELRRAAAEVEERLAVDRR
ncbi:MAG: helix-turn-helix domain-containing protein [Planctomycetota bacterium]